MKLSTRLKRQYPCTWVDRSGNEFYKDMTIVFYINGNKTGSATFLKDADVRHKSLLKSGLVFDGTKSMSVSRNEISAHYTSAEKGK